MKLLIWKEWYELRKLPWITAASISLLTAAFDVADLLARQKPNASSTMILLIPILWLAALVAGAGLFSQDIGCDGLVFLGMLPVSRGRIWWVKVLTGFAVVLLCVVSSTLAWAATNVVFVGKSQFDLIGLSGITASFAMVRIGIELLALLTTYLIAVSVSPVFDRLMTALLASCAAYLGYYIVYAVICAAMMDVAHSFSGSVLAYSQDALFPHMVTGVTVPVLMVVSYMTFTRGESLRTSKRLVVGAKALAASLGVAMVFFFVGFQLRWW